MRNHLYFLIILTLISCREIKVRDIKIASEIAKDVGAEKFEYNIVKFKNNIDKTNSSHIEFCLYNPSLLDNSNFSKSHIASYCAFTLYTHLAESAFKNITGINVVFEKHQLSNLNFDYFYSLEELKTMRIKTKIIDSFVYKCRKRDTLDLYNYLDETLFSFNSSDAYNIIFKKVEIVDYQILYFFDDKKDDTAYYNITAAYKIFNVLQSNSNFLMRKDSANNKIFSIIP